MKRTLKESIRHYLLPRDLKDHRIRGGYLRGNLIFTSWRDYPGAIRGTTEQKLIGWFRSNVRPGETWIDIGAHYGYTALALAKLVGPTGSVFAFEPVLASAGSAAITRRLNKYPHLRVAPFALGAESGIHSFDLPVIRGMADSTIQGGDWVEPLLVTSFDFIWPSLSPSRQPVHGIKIDVQGMEIETLKGMAKTLERDHPKLVIEFHRGVDRRVALGLLEGAGYATTPWAIEGGFSGEIEDDKSYAFEPLVGSRVGTDA